MASHGNVDYVINERFLGTFTYTDGAGTPNVFTVEMYGEVKIEDGGYNRTFHHDENGDFVSYPATRGKAQTTKWTMSAKQIGLPGQTADATLVNDLTLGDFIHHSGEYANMTSTITGAGSRNETHFDIAITLTDGTNTTTYSLSNAVVYGSFGVGEEGNKYDITIEAPQPYTTVAYA